MNMVSEESDAIGWRNPPIIKLWDMGALWYDIIISCEVYYWSRYTLLAPSLLPFFRPTIHPQVARRIRYPTGEVGLPCWIPTIHPSSSSTSSLSSSSSSRPPELWGSIREEACKGSADATRLSTFHESGPLVSLLSACPVVYCFRMLVKQLFHFLPHFFFLFF